MQRDDSARSMNGHSVQDRWLDQQRDRGDRNREAERSEDISVREARDAFPDDCPDI